MQYRHITKDFTRRQMRQKMKLKKQFMNFHDAILATPTLTINSNAICKSRLKNICLESGLDRSVISKYNISRHFFKKTATQAKLPGLRKASW